METWETYSFSFAFATCRHTHPQKYTNTARLCTDDASSCHVIRVSWSKAWLKALCHFHHERISIKTTNFSPFSTSSAFGSCIHFSEPAWIFQGWVTAPVKNEKKEEVGGKRREVQGGMDNHISFFAELINDLCCQNVLYQLYHSWCGILSNYRNVLKLFSATDPLTLE